MCKRILWRVKVSVSVCRRDVWSAGSVCERPVCEVQKPGLVLEPNAHLSCMPAERGERESVKRGAGLK